MSLVAGLDVGNSTTEVVLADTAFDPPVPVAWDRLPTRGVKGSVEAWRGAAALVRRLERRTGLAVDSVIATVQRPAITRTLSLRQATPATGRLEVITASGSTPGGLGLGVGAPAWLSQPVAPGPVVLLAPRGLGFAEAARLARTWIEAGADVQGLLLADDEGTLVAARLPRALPVVDEVEVDRLVEASLVAVEVRPPGHPLHDLVDAFRLSTLLGLSSGERSDAASVADTLGDTSRGVVALFASGRAVSAGAEAYVVLRAGGTTAHLRPAELASLAVGAVAHLGVPGQADWAVDDLWAVELREIASSVAARLEPATARALVVAGLLAGAEAVEPRAVLEAELELPTQIVGSEATAARAGALATPGVNVGAVVVDLGGGTVDVMSGADQIVSAGAGEMLTSTVAAYLGVPRGAADWIKRGPCVRLESPHVLLAEDGTRTFLDIATPQGSVGSLVIQGPAGMLPFGGALAPAEWRALRVRAKERVLADNVARSLRSLDLRPDEVLLVGGAAADEELLTLVRRGLPGAVVGRADVAGRLGHRYAVAYGLLLLSPE